MSRETVVLSRELVGKLIKQAHRNSAKQEDIFWLR
jgi:hypothetical protein